IHPHALRRGLSCLTFVIKSEEIHLAGAAASITRQSRRLFVLLEKHWWKMHSGELLHECN
ncbi:MAG: hypothetical protein ACE5PV_04075, partial [Candidatus Poribacteria bacterium]